MNKELLISIKPEHLVNILNGKKTLELRKTVPKDYKGWVNIYCTKGVEKTKHHHLYNLTEYNNGKTIFAITHHNKYSLVPDNFLNGKVVARFWFDEYEKYENTDLYSYTYRHRIDKLFNQACITADELYKYIKKVKPEEETTYRKYYPFYAWHIKKLEIFDKPKELRDFASVSNYKHIVEKMAPYEKNMLIFGNTLKRPPQSYQFVYVKE